MRVLVEAPRFGGTKDASSQPLGSFTPETCEWRNGEVRKMTSAISEFASCGLRAHSGDAPQADGQQHALKCPLSEAGADMIERRLNSPLMTLNRRSSRKHPNSGPDPAHLLHCCFAQFFHKMPLGGDGDETHGGRGHAPSGAFA